MKKNTLAKKFKALPIVFKMPLFVSCALLIASIAVLVVNGIRLDIDFVGGSILEIERDDDQKITKDSIENSVGDILPENTNIIVIDEQNKATIEMSEITDEKHSDIIEKLKKDSTFFKEGELVNNEKFEFTITTTNGSSLDKNEIQKSLREVSLFGYNIELIDDNKSAKISGDVIGEGGKQEELVEQLKIDNSFLKEISFRNVGSIIGEDTKNKAILSLSLALIGIILYLAWAFRKVSQADIGFKSWHYGLAAIITLIHDLLFVLGLFAILSYFLNISVGTYFLVALLTILGYSVNDTIVVFDRLRENLLHNEGESLGELMVLSIKQTAKRSINTSLTTLLVLVFLYFIGGTESDVIKYFSIALFAGIAVGTYSSIFIANSILFFLHKDN